MAYYENFIMIRGKELWARQTHTRRHTHSMNSAAAWRPGGLANISTNTHLFMGTENTLDYTVGNCSDEVQGFNQSLPSQAISFRTHGGSSPWVETEGSGWPLRRVLGAR